MEYESDRAMIESKMEDAKIDALGDFEKYFDLKGEVQDPNWAQPAPLHELTGVGVDQAQGLWINDGKKGGLKDEVSGTTIDFSHDLPGLPAKAEDIEFVKPDPESLKPLTPEKMNELIKSHLWEDLEGTSFSSLRVSTE